jgi:ribosomal protein L29
MKKPSYSGKNRDELVRALTEARTTLREYRFSTSGAKPKNLKDARAAKKNIARVMTELNKNK